MKIVVNMFSLRQVLMYWLFGISLPALAQSDIALGSWRLHLSYQDIQHVEVSPEKIFAASSNGILIFDKAEASLATVNKLDGLSGTGITALGYDLQSKSLIAGYADGSVDIITGNTVANFHRLREADVTAARTINHIAINNGFAYLSTAYGVVVFNIGKQEIKETWRDLGPSGESLAVNATTFLGDSVFLATAHGVLAGNLTDNLLDFNNWKRFNNEPFAGMIKNITTFNNTIYASGPAGVYSYTGGSWSEPVLESTNVVSLSASDDNLFITADNTVYALGTSGNISPIADPVISSPSVVEQDEAGNLWIGDRSSGLLSNTSGSFASYLPNGPSQNAAFRLTFHEGRLFVVSGGFNPVGQPLGLPGKVNIYENGQWISLDQPLSDLTDVAFHANSMFVSSFDGGIAITDGSGNVSILDESNSPLNNLGGNGPKITALRSTTEGLLIALYGGGEPAHLMKTDGSWASFSFGMPNEDKPIDIAVDGNGNIWLVLDPVRGGGLIAYDVKNDQPLFKSTATGQGALPHKNVNSIAMDREGYAWIGTDAGVAYFFGPGQDALKPIYENRFLLRDEKITAIEVDGGNRKWIGTTRGLWLFNDSGELLINHFTTENSALLSNHIRDIEINDHSGEVFISTEGGLVSYRSDASKGNPEFGSVKIFPNPVHPGFNGLVGITGLATDAEIRITDINGKLLWNTTANGGTATWNLRDQRGNRATTGVYLVFAIAQDGRESVVGKIAVIE